MPALLRRGWNWCRRFRHRKGYGVHSPSDFYLITFVIYERAAYNAYSSLHKLRKGLKKSKSCYREKTDKLLLRLANYLQPKSMLEIGTGSGIDTCYLASGKASPLLTLTDTENGADTSLTFSTFPLVTQREGEPIVLLKQLINRGELPTLIHLAHTKRYEECFKMILPHAQADTCVIIGNPHANNSKLKWWNELIKDPRTGVTFDLYDIGIVFFDKKRIKEHRIVNFL